tara:strand:- start:388 stop:1185 length:798 start_codon:yes stop_codon:yes gene_type:complete
MSKGFLWFAQNNEKTDYVELSIKLAKSIKRYNRQNKVCVVTDKNSKLQKNKDIDIVRVLHQDDSADHKIKWANEWKAFDLTPFTHTIKLEADMLWTTNTDWWWYHLWQNDLVFSVDCKNYRDETIKDTTYRQIFIKNQLPNIYNGLMYFRKSTHAQKFFKFAQYITDNWQKVKTTMLIDCHDTYPSTDIVFALAYRMLDPTNKKLFDYEWFKFIHHKPAIHKLTHVKDHNQYLYPNKTGDAVYLGEKRLSRVWHYFHKELNVRTS